MIDDHYNVHMALFNVTNDHKGGLDDKKEEKDGRMNGGTLSKGTSVTLEICLASEHDD